MYCDVVWGGFNVVWCVLGCFHGPRQYNTVFSVTNEHILARSDETSSRSLAFDALNYGI